MEEVDDEIGVRAIGERVVDLSDRDDLLEGVGVEIVSADPSACLIEEDVDFLLPLVTATL